MTWAQRLPVVAALIMLVGCTESPGGGLSRHDTSDSPAAAHSAAGRHKGSAGWVVLVGDSYLSGEGSRWAGNTPGTGSRSVDALGADAYHDAGSHESEPGCHRAVHFARVPGARSRGAVLACSGATTVSQFSNQAFKPGLDFFSDDRGHVGQALALQRFAAVHFVSDVVVSIGGNDLGFASIVATCAKDFVSTVGSTATLCRDDRELEKSMRSQPLTRLADSVARALSRTARAMLSAGYGPRDYSMIVQTYPSPLAPGGRNRYGENQFERTLVGGCPVYDADATWANRVVLPRLNAAVAAGVKRSGIANASLLDLSHVLVGHRLCEQGAASLPHSGVSSWRDNRAARRLEWVTMLTAKPLPWQLQESLHPNYWGTLAERRCLRRMLESAPAGESVSCTQARSRTGVSQPAMRLSSLPQRLAGR